MFCAYIGKWKSCIVVYDLVFLYMEFIDDRFLPFTLVKDLVFWYMKIVYFGK